MTRDEIVADARLWVGTPYVHQARVRGVGSDCIGVIGGIARDRGTPEGLAWERDPAAHDYGPIPNPRRLLEQCAHWLDRIATTDAVAGDVLLMRFTDDPQHFALLVTPTYIVHASQMVVGRVVETRLDDAWRNRVVRAYRYRGISA